MLKKLLQLFIASTMVFSLMLVKNTNVYAAEINLWGEENLFTKPEQIQEDADLLAELDSIGHKLKESNKVKLADLYRWIYDIRFLNTKYSESVSSSKIDYETNRVLESLNGLETDNKGYIIDKEKNYTNIGSSNYQSVGVVLTSLQKEIKGENPFSSLREAKDQQLLSQIKSGAKLSDLRENPKMTVDDERYFYEYYQKGINYREEKISLDDYKDWIISLKKLNKKYPTSSMNTFLDNILEYSYSATPVGYYDQIFGALNSLWDQTHYDFAHVTSNTLDSIEINQNPSKSICYNLY